MTPPAKKQGERLPWFAWLTCKRKIGVGPRRLLLVISVPFFVFGVIPGILFWLLVKLVLWVISGFRHDRRLHDSAQNN